MTSATIKSGRAPLLALAAAATLVLAACGGGGGGGSNYFPIATAPTTPAPTTPPVTNDPPAAADPYDTFLAYVKSLIGNALDTVDAFDVASFDPPPTSETKDPIPTE